MMGSISKVLLGISLAISMPSGLWAQDSEFSSTQENLLVAVGYVGLAEYCWAYGVDYRSKANVVKDSILEEFSSDDYVNYRLANFAFDAAARGEIYSPAAEDFVSLKDSSDIETACNNMYVQFQRLSRIR